MLEKHPDCIVPCVPLIPKSKNTDDKVYLEKLGKMLV